MPAILTIKMKNLIIVPFLFLVVFSSAQKMQKTGYLVVVTIEGKTTCKKTDKITTVEAIISNYFPEISTGFIKMLKTSKHIQITTQSIELYIEKKRITKHNKYRRLRK